MRHTDGSRAALEFDRTADRCWTKRQLNDAQSKIQNPKSPTLLILGPTASGKTALAIELARRLPWGAGGECVSADSMQIYRGMDIGTGKAPPQEWQGVPHHLIDIVEPSDDSFSVDRWVELCNDVVEKIRGRGGTPIIVGGTNLYVQALVGGLADALPAPDVELRARLNEMPLEHLRQRLEEVDPEAAQRIHLNDRKRTVRAIEVFEQTGAPLSAMQQEWAHDRRPRNAMRGRHAEAASTLFVVGLEYPIEAINHRINARVKAMIEQGLVDEVRRLHMAGALGRNAREGLGYKQIIDHLEGRCSLDDAIEQIKIRTRRFAKQQRTWLRRFRNHQPSTWLDATDQSTQTLADKALAAIAAWQREPSGVSNDATSAGIDLGDCAP